MLDHTISIIIPIVPKAQMRARHRIVKTKDGRTFSTTYKAQEQCTAEQKFMAMLYQFKPEAVIEDFVLLGVKAYLPIPKSKPNRWKMDADAGIVRPCGKPDLSNLIKFVEDCMNGVFWRDDAQIVGFLPGTGKYYSHAPRWEITVIF